MEKGRLKWWLLLLAGVLAAAVCGASVFMCTRPKLALTSALPKLFSQLEERFRGDPLRMAAEVFDQDGKYTADVRLRTGTVIYDMTAQTDFSTHCFFADGRIYSSEKAVDISLYLDASIAAISSEELVKGNYYGIAYDSFSSDIRNMPMFSPFVSEEVLDRWTDSVRRIKETMSWEYPKITLPTLSNQEVKTLLLGMAALPCSRETVSVPINGEILSCLKLDYFLDGEQLESMLGKTSKTNTPEGTAVSASFYLYDNSVVKLRIQDQKGKDIHAYTITFGRDPLHDTLSFEGNENLAGKSVSYCVYVETKPQINGLTQTIRYSSGQSAPAVYTYQWEETTGTMYLKTDTISTPVKLSLCRKSNGIQISTVDLGKIISILFKDPKIPEAFDGVECTMVVQTGSNIVAPDYKNLDTWSFDDLLILMGGLGSVIGFPFIQ